MRPTRLRVLLAVAVVAAAIGWGAVRLVDSLGGRILPVPWTAGAATWLLAAGVGLWALLIRPRLRRAPGAVPLAPIVAARSAALAMAASRTGAAVAGFYAGAAVGLAPMLHIPAAAQRFTAAVVAATGAAALVAVALWLERLCRLPDDHDDDRGDGPSGDGAGGVRGGGAVATVTDRPSSRLLP
ncbi:MAG: DUF3180 domain-containing protein [Actinomycetota bacterium]|nr:MAG: DUF3180 domain-containing protein [Actinomycetota bacterium]